MMHEFGRYVGVRLDVAVPVVVGDPLVDRPQRRGDVTDHLHGRPVVAVHLRRREVDVDQPLGPAHVPP
jgi:hypothetical protein